MDNCHSNSDTVCISKEQIQNNVWVQCENPDCLKWRRISQAVAETLGDESPWFCSMNADKQHSRCGQPEEDYGKYERAAKKLNLTYVSSALKEGSLVWAKLQGYVRWPSVICKDPDEGIHVQLDGAGRIFSYHVEFLGQKHTHGWVNHKQVQLYGTETENSGVTETPQSRRRRRGRHTKLGSATCGLAKQKRHHGYHGNSVEKAIIEADRLMDVSHTGRLRICTFSYKCDEEISVPGFILNQRTKSVTNIKKSKPVIATNGRRPKKLKKSFTEKIGKEQSNQVKQQASKSVTLNRAKPMTSCRSSMVTSYKSKPVTSCKPSTVTSYKSKTVTSCESKSVTSYRGEPAGRCHGEQEGHKQLRDSLQMCQSKEEKFMIDLQNYARNEKIFETNLRSFHLRHNTFLARPPFWNGVRVTYFQLYQAVQDRGGYEQVNKKKMWSSVLRELILSDSRHMCAHSVKQFYSKYLYTYELYVAKKPYKHALVNHRALPHKGAKHMSEGLQEVPEHSTQPPVHAALHTHETASRSDTESEMSADLRGIFQDIEETGNEITYGLLQENIKQDSERLGVDVKFYGKVLESPVNSCARLPTEPCPSENAQVVPHIMNAASPTSSVTSTTASDVSDTSSQHERVLHEMQVLQQELDQLQDATSEIKQL